MLCAWSKKRYSQWGGTYVQRHSKTRRGNMGKSPPPQAWTMAVVPAHWPQMMLMTNRVMSNARVSKFAAREMAFPTKSTASATYTAQQAAVAADPLPQRNTLVADQVLQGPSGLQQPAHLHKATMDHQSNTGTSMIFTCSQVLSLTAERKPTKGSQFDR